MFIHWRLVSLHEFGHVYNAVLYVIDSRREVKVWWPKEKSFCISARLRLVWKLFILNSFNYYIYLCIYHIIVDYCWYHQQIANVRRTKLKCFSSCLAVAFTYRCYIENEDVIRAAPTGDAPTTSEWSTIYCPLRCDLYKRFDGLSLVTSYIRLHLICHPLEWHI